MMPGKQPSRRGGGSRGGGSRTRRRAARELLLQAFYAWDVGRMDLSDDALEMPFRTEIEGEPDDAWVQELIRLFTDNTDFVDDRIRNANSRWRVERMDKVDLSILRLGVTELYFTDTPAQIIINEGIELAKRYGSETSARFVNGVLDAVRKSRPNE
ncbi:transcription antitermination factor NusB [Myxococcota bacterium]|nr:transcription antitermination factor NusB [Myxococcota bacterium]MBU1410621.1 transcription antitermination factor NusB [Myxococcota bacterium]MBU1511230.1 transcription antitermination factor NusB [Myxococcota bacterium]